MKAMNLKIKPIVIALFAAGVLSACGGGGGGDPVVGGAQTPPPSGGAQNPPPGDGTQNPPPGGGTQAPTLTMSCADVAPEGQQVQCSGGTVLTTDNGVLLTRSGVQVFGISTSDLPLDTAVQGTPHGIDTSNPRGFALPSATTTPLDKAVAEVRLTKSPATNDVSRVGLLLSGFGLFWDGTNERPPIIETFATTRSRAELDAAGAITTVTLPPGTDTTFFNRATPLNYANNTYFPLIPTAEKPAGIGNNPLGGVDGGWRTGGTRGDFADTGRIHEDGDLDAPTALAGTAGSKGFRGFTNIAYQYANVAAWASQDTVNLAEWQLQPKNKVEHNKERRGVVAFGDVTSPTAMPTEGNVTYTGTVYGMRGRPAAVQDDPEPFVGDATVTVNYADGTATVAIANTVTFDALSAPVDAAFTATAARGAVASTNAPNYFTGAVSATGLAGGVSGRYFGPDAKEVGGTFQLAGPGETVYIGGFVARKP